MMMGGNGLLLCWTLPVCLQSECSRSTNVNEARPFCSQLRSRISAKCSSFLQQHTFRLLHSQAELFTSSQASVPHTPLLWGSCVLSRELHPHSHISSLIPISNTSEETPSLTSTAPFQTPKGRRIVYGTQRTVQSVFHLLPPTPLLFSHNRRRKKKGGGGHQLELLDIDCMTITHLLKTP
ncbi:hypothetical protein VTK56DRAFT_5600 [Thermocarpiscus australiensis]